MADAPPGSGPGDDGTNGRREAGDDRSDERAGRGVEADDERRDRSSFDHVATADEPTDERSRAESSPPDGGDDDDGRLAPEPSSAPVRPGSPEPENVLFVVLGAVAMGLVILRLAAIGFGG